MSSVQALELGKNLEEFTFVKLLGTGGFGITYQALDRTLQRHVAIKEYFPQQFAERKTDDTIVSRPGEENTQTFQWGLERFLAEARTLARIDHPNVVKVSRYFERNGTAYLVMAFEEGKDLEDWLRAQTDAPTEEDIHRLILPLLDGLEAIHDQGLIHRDIKPRNIVIRGNGTPVLIDFGSARAVGQEQTSVTALISPGYSPPEQYSNDPSGQGPWTDIYAMAGVVYRMLSGSGPPDAMNRISGTAYTPAGQAALLKLSPSILEAVDRGLELEIGKRPKSVSEFRALLLGEPVPTPARTQADATTLLRGAPGTVPQGSASRLPWLLGAFAVIGIGLAGTFFYTQSPSPAADVAADNAQPTAQEAGSAQPASKIPPANIEESSVPLRYSLELLVTPEDAVVDVGGKPYTQGMSLPPGSHTIALSKPGYRSASREISLDQDLTLAVNLEEVGFPVSVVATPANANVKIDNIPQAYFSGMELKPGDYQIQVSATGYRPWSGTLTHGSEPTLKEIVLQKLHRLSLSLDPADASAQVDGRPYTPGMQLTTGEYAIAVEKPGFQSKVETVTIERDRVVEIDLTPSLGILTLILTPRDAKVVLPDTDRAYIPGMRLDEGALRIRVSRHGYETIDREIAIRAGNNAIAINLKRSAND